MQSKLEKNNPKLMNAWAMYDWSNSVYNLVITSTIFPIYYLAVTGGKGADVTFLGITLKNTTFYDFIIAFAYLLIVFIAPILSGIADIGGYKKRFMQMFTYIGAFSCSMLYFFDAEHLYIGVIFSILACIGYSGSLVFYNSFLPEIATPDKQDKLSAKGFALGYLGSAILLIVCLVVIQTSTKENVGAVTRMAFLLVGAWWLIFSQYTFLNLPTNVYDKKPVGNKFLKGYQELRAVFRDLKNTPNLKRFLFAFFVYNMGVQTIMLVANHFGAEEIKMETGQLITTILIIQFVAIVGAFLFSAASRKWGNLFTLRFATVIWALVCIATYLLVYTPVHFYFIAAVVGLIMGGIQALSRSTYSKMLPETTDHASYFSFYDICEKLSIVCGMLTFGIINEMSSGMRQPILILISFFIIGFLLLLRVKKHNHVE